MQKTTYPYYKTNIIGAARRFQPDAPPIQDSVTRFPPIQDSVTRLIDCNGSTEIVRWAFVPSGNKGWLKVNRNGTRKAIRVYPHSYYIYLLEGDHILAKDGADGLCEFIRNSIATRKEEQAAWSILEYAFQNGKLIKEKKIML